METMKNEIKASPSEKLLQDLLANAQPVAEVLTATHTPARPAVKVSSLESLNKKTAAAQADRSAAGLKIQDCGKATPKDGNTAGGGKVVAFSDRKPTDG
ncbi:MAG: hypothetical protein RIQ81_2205 [Pseudomonadota bacterium]